MINFRAGSRHLGAVTVGGLALLLVGCSDSGAAIRSAQTGSSTPSTSSVSTNHRKPQQIGSVLTALAVKGRAPATGYDRSQFGQAWSDDTVEPLGHNGCDTRNDILRRDLVDVVLRPGSNGCAVASGVLDDPYTGAVIMFRRGATASRVQIDHVVSLEDAWQTGAQYWPPARRVDFANDPLNLLAVDGPTNESKGDGDAASWLPPRRDFRCSYVARQIAVKIRYSLWVTPAERAAMTDVLRRCPLQAAPVEPIMSSESPTVSPSHTSSGARPSSSTSTDIYYPNCDSVRQAGAAPLHRGDPGYSTTLDRDGDGVACEP